MPVATSRSRHCWQHRMKDVRLRLLSAIYRRSKDTYRPKVTSKLLPLGHSPQIYFSSYRILKTAYHWSLEDRMLRAKTYHLESDTHFHSRQKRADDWIIGFLYHYSILFIYLYSYQFRFDISLMQKPNYIPFIVNSQLPYTLKYA